MIKIASSGHGSSVAAEALPESDSTPTDPDQAPRIRRIVRDHYELVWRLLRRMGVAEADAEDAAQQVFLVVARRLADILPDRERAFLSATAVRVAADARRAARRRPVELTDAVYETGDPAPGPEQLAEQRRARELLDSILERMAPELRAPFVLFEIEEMTMRDIATALDIPMGTVASRLRRAREWFRQAVTEAERGSEHD